MAFIIPPASIVPPRGNGLPRLVARGGPLGSPRSENKRKSQGSVQGLTSINSLSVGSDDADFFAADASKLYSQSNEAIFLFLIIGSEGILVHDDNRRVMCPARPRKVWENLFDNSDEVGFLPRKFRLVPVQHGQCLIAFRLKAAIRSRTYQTARMAVSPP